MESKVQTASADLSIPAHDSLLIAGAKRHLIVNADDFGLSPGVNRGIIEAHERGIVTSASLIVRGAAVGEAVQYAKSHPDLSLGLHLDMGEWAYVFGSWLPAYQVVPPDGKFRAVEHEAMRQLEMYYALIGQQPTHIDSRQHRHQHEPLRTVMLEVCRKLDIPLRQNSSAVTYWGYFFGQTIAGRLRPEAISVSHLIRLIRGVPEGYIEMNCHPAKGEDFVSRYRAERLTELRTLLAPEVRYAIEAQCVRLISFHDLQSDSATFEKGGQSLLSIAS